MNNLPLTFLRFHASPALCFFVFLCTVACTRDASETANTIPPDQWSRDWFLERRSDESILWQGTLPDGFWHARAIWRRPFGSRETMVLAEEKFAEKSLRLSLSPPHGLGVIDLEIAADGHETIRAWASTPGPARSFENLLAEARGARNSLEAEMAVANRYGVRRPEARAMLAIADIWLEKAGGLEGWSVRETEADWWMAYIAAECDAERTILVDLRDKPMSWTGIDDPPLQTLRVADEESTLEAGVWTPEGTRWLPVRLAGIEGGFMENDVPRVRALGFNYLASSGPIATQDTLPDALNREALQLNIVRQETLPRAAMVETTDHSLPDPELVRVFAQWPGASGTIDPWTLRAYSHKALRYRRGEKVRIPKNPSDLLNTLESPERPIAAGGQITIQNETRAPPREALWIMSID